MKKSQLFGALCACALTLLSSGPQAARLTWQLNGVTFYDGGTAIGSFDYDVDVNTFSKINITTTVGTQLSGSSYSLLAPLPYIESSRIVPMVSELPVSVGSTTIFIMIFDGLLSNAGGTIPLLINGAAEYICGSGCTSLQYGSERDVATGSVTSPVPIPPALWLFGSGLLGLIVIARGKKSA